MHFLFGETLCYSKTTCFQGQTDFAWLCDEKTGSRSRKNLPSKPGLFYGTGGERGPRRGRVKPFHRARPVISVLFPRPERLDFRAHVFFLPADPLRARAVAW